MSILNEKDLSLLHSHLIVPIAVGDIIYNNMAVEDDMEYGLHEALSEIDPDSALLAIAISAKHIALQFTKDTPVASALSLESSKIIDDYGPEWLANFNKGPVDEHMLHNVLRHVPEDLEILADLLDTLQAGLSEQQGPLAILCKVLSIQARAHMEIADFILKEIEGGEGELCGLADIMSAQKPSGDNIILFPIHLRQ